LELGDPLVTEVLGHAAEVLGFACLTVRHLIDPAAIVLGGGMLEACSDFIMPIVEKTVAEDCLPGARQGGDVFVSALGDDAVVLGAVALARTEIGDDPFKKGATAAPTYPEITVTKSGRFKAGQRSFDRDFYVTVGRKAKYQKVPLDVASDARPRITPAHLARACQGGPEVLFIGTGPTDRVELTESARVHLRRRAIECQALPTPEAVKAYNRSTCRKAALIHVG
jgi:glucokinase